ncbi:hypothetical protein HYX16_03415 [Candidatus Woesearchaeota archaeon]|nr:hypothetical protein [Candidatus Woesearchaeota archaeon]
MREKIITVSNGKTGHRLKKLREHNMFFCITCGEVIKNDGNLLEGNEFHGVE